MAQELKAPLKKNCDYDFAVTTKTPKKSSLEEMARIRSLIFKNLNISADIFIYSEKEFEEWKDEFNSIPEIALNLVKELVLLCLNLLNNVYCTQVLGWKVNPET